MLFRSFIKFACGSNGLVPLQKINGFTDFAQCRKEEHGLHEVAVEYDNTGKHLADLFAQMYKDVEGGDLWTQQYTGTKMSGHPVILSVLFDDAGVVKGMRAVTDSRARTDQRQVSNMLAVVIRNHYDPQNWTCEKLPLTGGETPIGNSFIKERCETVYRNESRMIVWRNLFRKAGQTGATATGQVAEGDFESSTRWERWALDVKVN